MVKYKDYDEAVTALKKWLRTQTHLPIIEDMPLKAFVIFCEGDVDAAKLLIDKQYTYRNNNPHIFLNRDIESESFKVLQELIDIVMLPDLTPDNHRVVVYRIRNPDTTNYSYPELVRTISIFFDALIRIQDIKNPPAGLYIIMDFSEYTLQHLTKVDLSAIRILAKFFEDLISVKIPCSHIIHTPTVMSRIIALAKTILAEKTVKKFKAYEGSGDPELYEIIPKDILPIEIHGTKGNMDDLKKETLQLLKDNIDYITNNKYWFVDESKRPPNSRKPQFSEMEGNFRALSVD